MAAGCDYGSAVKDDGTVWAWGANDVGQGADVNARADIDEHGVGGQTAIFHALTHFNRANPEVGELLIQRGANLTIRARIPGHYERPGELLVVSAAEYAALFPLR